MPGEGYGVDLGSPPCDFAPDDHVVCHPSGSPSRHVLCHARHREAPGPGESTLPIGACRHESTGDELPALGLSGLADGD